MIGHFALLTASISLVFSEGRFSVDGRRTYVANRDSTTCVHEVKSRISKRRVVTWVSVHNPSKISLSFHTLWS